MTPTEAERLARARWEGEMKRALEDAEGDMKNLTRKLAAFEDKHDEAVKALENRLGKIEGKIGELKVQVLIYGAAVGGGAGLVAMAFATKVIG